MKNMNNGEIVFVATSIGDYKVMTSNMQEIKRYIKQLGEVVVYYREVTLPNGEKGVKRNQKIRLMSLDLQRVKSSLHFLFHYSEER